jgi:hypothetical protein
MEFFYARIHAATDPANAMMTFRIRLRRVPNRTPQAAPQPWNQRVFCVYRRSFCAPPAPQLVKFLLRNFRSLILMSGELAVEEVGSTNRALQAVWMN